MIRHAKPSEIDKILEITRACGQKMTAEGIFQWNEHYPTKSAFEADIKLQQLFVLTTKNEEIMGCIVISSEKDEEYNDIEWLTRDDKQYYIHRVAVDPKFQKQGNARKMMDYAEELAKANHCVSVRLDTFSLNERNQRFYEARGYKRLGNIYFPKQSDAPFYCYELVLNP